MQLAAHLCANASEAGAFVNLELVGLSHRETESLPAALGAFLVVVAHLTGAERFAKHRIRWTIVPPAGVPVSLEHIVDAAAGVDPLADPREVMIVNIIEDLRGLVVAEWGLYTIQFYVNDVEDGFYLTFRLSRPTADPAKPS